MRPILRGEFWALFRAWVSAFAHETSHLPPCPHTNSRVITKFTCALTIGALTSFLLWQILFSITPIAVFTATFNFFSKFSVILGSIPSVVLCGFETSATHLCCAGATPFCTCPFKPPVVSQKPLHRLEKFVHPCCATPSGICINP